MISGEGEDIIRSRPWWQDEHRWLYMCEIYIYMCAIYILESWHKSNVWCWIAFNWFHIVSNNIFNSEQVLFVLIPEHYKYFGY